MKIIRFMIQMVLIPAWISSNLWAGNWTKIWGPTDFIVIDGETGAVFAKPLSGSSTPQGIYRWEFETNYWTYLGMPQAKKCVTSGWKPDNKLYCMSSDGVVYKYQGSPNSWESIGGPTDGKAGDIFGGPDQLLATSTGSSPNIFRWDELKNSWIQIGGPGKTFIVGRSSDPSFKFQVYGQSPDNTPPDSKGVYQWSGNWYKRGGPAGNIFISWMTLFATNPQSGDLLSLYPTGWKRIGGPANMFAPDHKGNIFGLSPDKNGVYRWTGIPNQWERIGDAADKIFAGYDRLLFATNPDTKELWYFTPECQIVGNVPNFAGTIITDKNKLRPVSGKRNLLTILWDPVRPEHPAPSKQSIEQILFGSNSKSAKDWYFENSGGKLELINAGILGWYVAPPEKRGNHYWDEAGHKAGNYNDGWQSGHIEKWSDAVKRAANDFNFSNYDFNHDGTITNDELAILVVIPQNNPFGTAGQPLMNKQVPYESLKLQGVNLTSVVEWYSGFPPNFGACVHESVHQILNTGDMYFDQNKGFWPYAASVYSNTDISYRPVHLSAPEKLKLGWLNSKVILQNGMYLLKAIETSNEALILYNPKRGPDEYFVVENRWRGTSFDAGASGLPGIPMDGIVIWHVIENPDVFNQTTPWPPTGVKDEWQRLGIRLIRANGGNPIDDNYALFNKKNTVISDLPTSPARLMWLNNTRSGFFVKLLTDAGPEVQLEIKVTCP